MYDTILFDLDGTLIDSGEGITNSVAYALKKYGITVSDKTQLYQFIGPPLHESFQKFYGFSEEESKRAVEIYREYYCSKGIFENYIYEGIETLLKRLVKAKKVLLVATSKPEVFARQILEYLKLADYFSGIYGANLDGSRTKKAEVISYALMRQNVTDVSKAVMVGDREHDILGAKKAGIDGIGVLFGYGNYEELHCAKADKIAKDTEEIFSFIMGPHV